ncbi:MAG: hypothetical protein JNK63_04910 [Chthonomonas sp.]|nr:hypothetical protein [Chthonomonas sp.]
MNRLALMMVTVGIASVGSAIYPGFDTATTGNLKKLNTVLPLPTWIPDGFRAHVHDEVFNVNGQRYITVEYRQQNIAKSFSMQFASVHLGTPIFADERARPTRVPFTSKGLGKSHFMTATVRGLPECQTPWISLKREGSPKYGSFVSLGIQADVAKRILQSVK